MLRDLMCLLCWCGSFPNTDSMNMVRTREYLSPQSKTSQERASLVAISEKRATEQRRSPAVAEDSVSKTPEEIQKQQKEIIAEISSFLLPELLGIVFEYTRTIFKPNPVAASKNYGYQILCVQELSPGKYLMGSANNELIEWDTNTGVEKKFTSQAYFGFMYNIIRLKENQFIIGTSSGLVGWQDNGFTEIVCRTGEGIKLIGRLFDGRIIYISTHSANNDVQVSMVIAHLTPELTITKTFDLRNSRVFSGCLISKEQVVTSHKNEIRVWDINQTKALRSIKTNSYSFSMAPLTEQQLLVAHGAQVVLYDLKTGEIVKIFECANKERSNDSRTIMELPRFRCLAALDPKRFVAAFKGVMYQWHIDKDEPERVFNRLYDDGIPYCMKALSDGKLFSAGNGNMIV